MYYTPIIATGMTILGISACVVQNRLTSKKPSPEEFTKNITETMVSWCCCGYC